MSKCEKCGKEPKNGLITKPYWYDRYLCDKCLKKVKKEKNNAKKTYKMDR